eukprot:2267572-Pleurochrysis_carterae.AAC.2
MRRARREHATSVLARARTMAGRMESSGNSAPKPRTSLDSAPTALSRTIVSSSADMRACSACGQRTAALFLPTP